MRTARSGHGGKLSGSGDASDLIWGIKPVAEALRHQPDRLLEIMVQRGKAGPRYQEIIDLARQHRLKLRFVDLDRLGLPARSPHQGVAASKVVVSETIVGLKLNYAFLTLLQLTFSLNSAF